MIAPVARNDVLTIRLAHQLPIVADEANYSVIGLTARICEEDVFKTLWQNRRNLAGQLSGWHCGGFEEGIVKWQIEHLLIGNFRQFLAAIADIDAPQAGHAVQDFIALAIPDINTISMSDDSRASSSVEGFMIRERMKVVVDIGFDNFVEINVFGMNSHDGAPDMKMAPALQLALQNNKGENAKV